MHFRNLAINQKKKTRFANLSFDIDLDVHTLVFDEAMQSAYGSPKHCSLGGRRNGIQKYWLACDERYSFEENDVDFFCFRSRTNIMLQVLFLLFFHSC